MSGMIAGFRVSTCAVAEPGRAFLRRIVDEADVLSGPAATAHLR